MKSANEIIPVHYGNRIVNLDIPKHNIAFNLKANEFPYPEDEIEEIRRAVREPVGLRRLKDIVPEDASVVIMGDDRTRETPQKKILPVVLEELHEAGVSNEQIKIVIAYGTHRPMTEEEIEEKYGRELMSQINITGHDCHNNLIDKGVTRRGTRIIVNREVLEADFRIAVGCVLPHHPVGWSGGAKMLLPGIAGVETTNAMHLLGATEQQLGKIMTPCRAEMEDFAREVGLHFILNVLQDEKGKIFKAVSGHFIDAHREAVKWGKKIFGVPFKEPADITVSSAWPADYDLTQADKGLFSAELATKHGGEIILLSPCDEGIAPTHGEQMAKLAGYDDDTLWKMLDEKVIEDPFGASECMYLNHIKRNFKATLTMDPVLTNVMGFHYLNINDVQEYINKRINLESNIKIGILHQSSEVLPQKI
jgi:lactate racemase